MYVYLDVQGLLMQDLRKTTSLQGHGCSTRVVPQQTLLTFPYRDFSKDGR